MLLSLVDEFTTGKAVFLTVRDPKGKRYQSVSQMSDHVKKVANTYIIVMEKNKKIEGHHMHVLLKEVKPPAHGFFTKGCHVNYRYVGSREACGLPPYEGPRPDPVVFTRRDYADAAAVGDVETMEVIEQQNEDKVITRLTKKTTHRHHIERVLNYMSKDLYLPAQYHDYIYVKAKKNHKLPGT